MNKRFNSIFTNTILTLIAFTLGIFLFSCAGVKESQKADMTFRLTTIRLLPFEITESYDKARYIVTAKSANYSKTLTFNFMAMINDELTPVENIIAKFDDVPVEESLTVSMVLAIPDSYKVPEYSELYQIENPALNSEEIRGATPEGIKKNFYFKPVYSASQTFTTKAGENFVNLKFKEQNNTLVINQAMSKNFMAKEFFELSEACGELVFDYVYFQNDIGLAVIKALDDSDETPESYYSNPESKWKSTSQTPGTPANASVYIDPATSDVYMLFCDSEHISNNNIYTLVIKKLSSEQSIANDYAGKIWADTADSGADYNYYYFENASTVHTGHYTAEVLDADEEQISPNGKFKASFYKAAEINLLAIGTKVYEVSKPTGTYILTFNMNEAGSNSNTSLYDITSTVDDLTNYKFQAVNIASGLYLDTTYNRYLLVNENGTAIAGRGMFFEKALSQFNNNKNSYMLNLKSGVGITPDTKRNYAISSPVRFKEIMQTYAPVYGPLAGLEGALNASRTKMNINGTVFSYSYDQDKERITVKPSSEYNPFSNVTGNERPNITLTKVDATFSKFWHDLKAGKCYIYNASGSAVTESEKLVFNDTSELTHRIKQDIAGESNSDFEKPVLVFIDKDNDGKVNTDPTSKTQFNFEGKSQVNDSGTSTNKDIYIDGNNLYIMNSYNGSDESSTFSSNAANLHLLNMELYGNDSASNQHGVKTVNSDVYLHNTKIKGFTADQGSAVLAGFYNNGADHNHGIFVCDENVLIGDIDNGDDGNKTTKSDTGYGGALHAPYVFMLDGTVSYNTADGEGGGIWADDFIMLGGKVCNNSAECGGGVYVKSRAHLFNGTVKTNTASTYGAGIFINCTQTSSNETLSEIGMMQKPNNWDLYVTDNKILASDENAIGAGLAFTNVKTTIFYGNFKDNQIINNTTNEPAGTGGAIGQCETQNDAIGGIGKAQITIAGGTFSGNKAKNGGVFGEIKGNLNTLQINGGDFTNNQATYGGVLARVQAKSGTNKKETLIRGGTYENNSAERGGVIYLEVTQDPTLYIKEGIFKDNKALKSGGVIHLSKKLYSTTSDNGNVSFFIGKKDNYDTATPDNMLVFKHNTSPIGSVLCTMPGESFENDAGIETKIFSGTFENNGGTAQIDSDEIKAKAGGVVYTDHRLYLYGGIFQGNTIYSDSETPYGAAFCINNQDFTENGTTYHGLGQFGIQDKTPIIGHATTPQLQNVCISTDNVQTPNDLTFIKKDDGQETVESLVGSHTSSIPCQPNSITVTTQQFTH